MRTRLYDFISKVDKNNSSLFKSLIKGSTVGVISSSVCMPLDSIRAHILFNSVSSLNNSPLSIIKQLGVPKLYNGLHVRATISALKFALFYTFMEIIQKIKIANLYIS